MGSFGRLERAQFRNMGSWRWARFLSLGLLLGKKKTWNLEHTINIRTTQWTDQKSTLLDTWQAEECIYFSHLLLLIFTMCFEPFCGTVKKMGQGAQFRVLEK